MAYDNSKPANDGFLAEFPPEMREQLRAIVQDAIVNALKVQGLTPGNGSGNLAVSNGNLCTNLNAEMLSGKKAGYFAADGHTHGAASGSTDGFLSNTDKSKLDSVQAGAEANQNAFGQVLVGNTTVQADSPVDTLELVPGANIALTPDAANDRITIAVTGKVASAATADTLQTARAIGLSGAVTGAPTSFNGGVNIIIPVTGLDVSAATSGVLSVARGGTGTGSVSGLVKGNGTNAVTAAVPGSDYVVPAGSITGNAATATKLTMARTINGIPFDGTANIALTPAQIGAAATSHSHAAADISGISTSGMQLSSSPGVHLFVAPAANLWITLCGGGGGGGGGATKTGTAGYGGGGGGGACGQCVERYPVSVTAGAVIYVTVGVGGQGGTSTTGGDGGDGAAGGASSFGAHISVLGGGGGKGGQNGGSGGKGGVSPIRSLDGGDGGRGSGGSSVGVTPQGFNSGYGGALADRYPGGGGGGGGSCWMQLLSAGTGGDGGPGGAAEAGSVLAGTGFGATTYGAGGGGGGGAYNKRASGAGGKGSDGFVCIEW